MKRKSIKNLRRISRKEFISMNLEGLNFHQELNALPKIMIQRFYDNDGIIKAVFYNINNKVGYLG